MGLYESLADEAVGTLTLRVPVLCSPDNTCGEAVGRMRRRKLGCTLVVDDDSKPLGIFTERMLTRLLVERPAALADPVEQRMSQHFVRVGLGEPVLRVLEAMRREDTRFVCVVDEEGRVAALSGQKGLMEFIADHFPQQVMVQRVGKRPPQQREGA